MTTFTSAQLAILSQRAIDQDTAIAAGIISAATEADLPAGAPDYWTVAGGYLPGLIFRYVSPSGEVELQLRPDVPVARQNGGGAGHLAKYLFAKGARSLLHCARPVQKDGTHLVLVVEGTCQAIVAARWAPETVMARSGQTYQVAVYGIAGCQSWMSAGVPTADLGVVEGHRALIALDADAATNRSVYDAGDKLSRAMIMQGGRDPRFIWLAASGTAGLDDVTAGLPPDRRTAFLERMLLEALERKGRNVDRPAPAKPSRGVDKTRKSAETLQALQEQAESDGRPLIDVGGDRLVVVEDLEGVLQDRYGSGAPNELMSLFRRGGALTGRDGAALEVLARDSLRDRVAMAARTGRENPATESWDHAWPDDGTLGALLSRARSFPPLDALVTAPFVRADGSVCAVNGYDAGSATFVRMNPELAGRLAVPERPTTEDVRAAVKLLLDDWLGDFPFPEQADRAGALALMLTPFVRGLVDKVPMAAVDGNGMSSGKGLLADQLSILVLGAPATVLAFSGEDEEARKAITATLLGGGQLVIWDEAHELKGRYLAQVLTAPAWSDRVLGKSFNAAIPVRVTWVCLGNNIIVLGDVVRRVYRIRVHPMTEHPEDRPTSLFRHADLSGWALEHRADLLTAVLTLIRSWHVAGRPPGADDFGSFEKWQRTVGGILANAGVPGFLDGLRDWRRQTDDEGAAWQEHLAWLVDRFEIGEPFRAATVAEEMRHGGGKIPVPSHRRELASPGSTKNYAQLLGKEYQARAGRQVDGHVLVRATLSRGHVRWVVEESKTSDDSHRQKVPEDISDGEACSASATELDNSDIPTPEVVGVVGVVEGLPVATAVREYHSSSLTPVSRLGAPGSTTTATTPTTSPSAPEPAKLNDVQPSPWVSKIRNGIQALCPERPKSLRRCPVCGAPLELFLDQLLLCPRSTPEAPHVFIPEE